MYYMYYMDWTGYSHSVTCVAITLTLSGYCIVPSMCMDTDLVEYIGKDVLHMLVYLMKEKKVRLDYKITGNDNATNIVLRFGHKPSAMDINSTPIPYSSRHKSPSNIRRYHSRNASHMVD